MPEELKLNWSDNLSLSVLLFNLAIGVVLALVLRWHFKKFGSTLSNRDEFSQVFPFVLLTTILIISVVKSSLALSLGLVGALSIVRFRTPIKEPEELAYLFISIAMGLGLGANQTAPTVIAGLAILAIMAFFKRTRRTDASKQLYLSLDWQNQDETQKDSFITRLNDIIIKHVESCDLRRFDVREKSIEATYLVNIYKPETLSELVDELRHNFPSLGATVLDQSQMPSI
jgi:hypothetical protein